MPAAQPPTQRVDVAKRLIYYNKRTMFVCLSKLFLLSPPERLGPILMKLPRMMPGGRAKVLLKTSAKPLGGLHSPVEVQMFLTFGKKMSLNCS